MTDWELCVYDGYGVMKDRLTSDTARTRLKELEFELFPFGICGDATWTCVAPVRMDGAAARVVDALNIAFLDRVTISIAGNVEWSGRLTRLPPLESPDCSYEFAASGQLRLSKTMWSELKFAPYSGDLQPKVLSILEGKLGVGQVVAASSDPLALGSVKNWQIDERWYRLDAFLRSIDELVGGDLVYGFRADGKFIFGRRPSVPTRTLGRGEFEPREAPLANRLYCATEAEAPTVVVVEDAPSVARDGALEEYVSLPGKTETISSGGLQFGILPTLIVEYEVAGEAKVLVARPSEFYSAISGGFYSGQDGLRVGKLIDPTDRLGLLAWDTKSIPATATVTRAYLAARYTQLGGTGTLDYCVLNWLNPATAWVPPMNRAALPLAARLNFPLRGWTSTAFDAAAVVRAGTTRVAAIFNDRSGAVTYLVETGTVDPGLSRSEAVLIPASNGVIGAIGLDYEYIDPTPLSPAVSKAELVVESIEATGVRELARVLMKTPLVAGQKGTLLLPIKANSFALLRAEQTVTGLVIGAPLAAWRFSGFRQFDVSRLVEAAENLLIEKYGPTLRGHAILHDEFVRPGGEGVYRYSDLSEVVLIDQSAKYRMSGAHFSTEITGGSRSRYTAPQRLRVEHERLASRVSSAASTLETLTGKKP